MFKGILAFLLAVATLFYGQLVLPAYADDTANSGKASDVPASKKKALLIAVHKYDYGRPNDAWDLHTIPDVQALQAVLVKKYGFSPDNITILEKQEDTTRAAILGALSKLIANTNPGDT